MPVPLDWRDGLRIEDKRLVGDGGDVHQLEPIKYKWAFEDYKAALANTWTPDEIPMSADVAQWNGDELTDDERRIVERSLGFFSTADSLVADNLVLGIYRHMGAAETRLFLLRQAFEEALHTHSYQHVVNSLGIEPGKVFEMYRTVPSVQAKAEWAVRNTSVLANPRFVLDTDTSYENLMRDLIAFYLGIEGIHFMAGFSLVLNLSRRGLMRQTAEQFKYIMRDESLHCAFGTKLINILKREEPQAWNADRADNILREAVELEIAYARDTVPNGVMGMALSSLERYLRHVGNRRAASIGLEPLWPQCDRNPFPWLEGAMTIAKEVNFFEGKVTDYKNGGELKW